MSAVDTTPVTVRYWCMAAAVVDSPAVLSVYAACEWDCLDDDGKSWVEAIVRETVRQYLAEILDQSGGGK